jgi:hypothetical protein
MGTATGLGGASGRYPTIVVVAQPWKEEEGIAWMIRTTIVKSTMWMMTSNGNDEDAMAEEGV